MGTLHRVRQPWRSHITAAVLCVLITGFTGCASGKVKINGVKYPQEGIASWYGKEYHGRTTASGERYDMMAMTAAHRTLPFGTRVRVTNLENGRQVTVRINDRGPFIRGRIIDLSYAAARRINMIRQGLVRVRVDIISSPLANLRRSYPLEEPQWLTGDSNNSRFDFIWEAPIPKPG